MEYYTQIIGMNILTNGMMITLCVGITGDGE